MKISFDNYRIFCFDKIGHGLSLFKWVLSDESQTSTKSQIYIEVLRRMTPEPRLNKAFELSEFSKSLFIQGLRKRYPELSEAEFHELLLARLESCHYGNY